MIPTTYKPNGRLDIKTPDTRVLFQMKDKIPVKCSTYHNATDGIWDSTALSTAFFSQQNVQIIQNGIRAGVYEQSNRQYVVGPQDCDAIKIVMRSIFLQFSKNQPTHIPEQIAELNKMVLNYCIQQVYGEAQSYMKYINDVSTLVVPMAPPVMTSTHNKQLEFKGWF